MAQFGAAKNPPWARDGNALGQAGVVGVAQPQVGPVVSGMLTQPGVASQAFSIAASQPTTQQTLAQQFNAQQLAVAGLQMPGGLPPTVQLPQPGIAIPTTLATSQVATVSYPAPRATNPITNPKQRVFTGTVTKLHDNFGFVDEDVFFQTGCVKGVIPKVADRVLVEATYNANMPFKWNATRIQVLPNQLTQGGMIQQAVATCSSNHFSQPNPALNLRPPMISPLQIAASVSASLTASMAPSTHLHPTPLMGNNNPTSTSNLLHPLQVKNCNSNSRLVVNEDDNVPSAGGSRGNIGNSRKNDIGANFGRDRDRERIRERDNLRHHERRERRSPRKRSRSPRKSRSPTSRTRSPTRRRAGRAVARYMVQVPKLSFDMNEANVILLKSRYANLYIPSDFFNAAFSWVDAFPLGRPFNFGTPCNFHVMSKDVEAVKKADLPPDPTDADHLYSAKVMLLACPTILDLYHKSCALAEDTSDHKDNFQHPTRLIQFLVGLKGKSEPMAIGGPWSPSLDGPNPGSDPRVLIKTAIRTTRMLTGIDLSACTHWYHFAEMRYHRPEEMHKGRLVPARVETVVIFLPDVWSCSPSHLEWEAMQSSYKKQLQQKIAEENKDETQDDEDDNMDGDEEKKDPTHHADLDPKNMKVIDLRRELECRLLSAKGLKSQLIARLTKALKSEQEKEEQEAETNKDEDESTKPEEDEKKETDEKDEERRRKEEEEQQKREERERVQRERRYTLPDSPAIIVHPSPTAKSGKFDCTVMSLSVLLDYRPEDNKEHSFEVSLFAELFNEMLMRDFAFRIYKYLVHAPEKKEDEKKQKEKDKDRDKDKKEKKEEKTKIKEEKDEDEKEPDVKKRKVSEDDEKDKTRDKKDKKEEGKEETNKEKSEAEKSEKEERQEENEKPEKDKRRDKEKDSKEKDSKEKDKKREKTKYVTEKPDLLLACVYFDQTHTGYLMDKDLEEIIHTVGMHLSRSQVKKMVQKVVSRETFNYRKVTDLPVKEDINGDQGAADRGASPVSVPEDTVIARGNTDFIPHHKSLPKPCEGNNSSSSDKPDSENNLVLHNGALVDVSSVMQRLEKSEKSRFALEDKLREIQDHTDTLKQNLSVSEKNAQRSTSEVQELKKKLREQRKVTESTENSSRQYLSMVEKSQTVLSSLLSDIKGTLSGQDATKDSTIKHETNGE